MRFIEKFQGDTAEFYYFVNETCFSLTGFSSKGPTIRVLLTAEKVLGLSAGVGSTAPYSDKLFCTLSRWRR
jgi:hypothetical protein